MVARLSLAQSLMPGHGQKNNDFDELHLFAAAGIHYPAALNKAFGLPNPKYPPTRKCYSRCIQIFILGFSNKTPAME